MHLGIQERGFGKGVIGVRFMEEIKQIRIIWFLFYLCFILILVAGISLFLGLKVFN